ncbi:MAG: hypothetical protein COZ50_05120 [Zetaproteobacteria bacterium CG_4_10_14_3_um_filter_54_28]|nr:MAG: hypothetical protein COZ50_05120 [Zetaproteobacteria bacterium CG_4_10_14_3_um_filter_54_28]
MFYPAVLRYAGYMNEDESTMSTDNEGILRKTGDLPNWYEMDEVSLLPLPFRLYASWVKYGLKRKNGYSLGGSFIFSLIRMWYRRFPLAGDNFVSLPWQGNRFLITLDLLDFEVINHTLPLLSGASSESKLVQMLMPERGVFFDVGANHGVFSLLAASQGGDEAVVHAFEPQPRLAHAIELSKKLNHFSSLNIHNIALGAKEESKTLYLPRESSGVASLIELHVKSTDTVAHEITVKVDLLDTVVEEMGIGRMDLIKIDVEGFELDVFQGGEKSLKKLQPFIWFEMSPAGQETAGHGQSEIYHLLEQFGYHDFYDIRGIACGYPVKAGVVNSLTNVLAVPVSRQEQLHAALETIRSQG